MPIGTVTQTLVMRVTGIASGISGMETLQSDMTRFSSIITTGTDEANKSFEGVSASITKMSETADKELAAVDTRFKGMASNIQRSADTMGTAVSDASRMITKNMGGMNRSAVAAGTSYERMATKVGVSMDTMSKSVIEKTDKAKLALKDLGAGFTKLQRSIAATTLKMSGSMDDVAVKARKMADAYGLAIDDMIAKNSAFAASRRSSFAGGWGAGGAGGGGGGGGAGSAAGGAAEGRATRKFLGKTSTYGLGVGAVGVGGAYELLKQGFQFDIQAQRFQANTGVSDNQMKYIKTMTIDLAKQYGANMKEVMTSYMHAANSGLFGARATAFVRNAILSALPTGANVVDINQAMLAARAAFGFKATPQSARTIINIAHRAAQLGDMTVPQMAEALPQFAITAAALGGGKGKLSLSRMLGGAQGGQTAYVDMESMLAALSRTHMTLRQGVTQLRNMFVHIAGPSGTVKGEIATIYNRTQGRVDLRRDFSLAGTKQKGFYQIIEDLAKYRQAGLINSGDILKLLPNVRGGFLGALSLTGNQQQGMIGIRHKLLNSNQFDITGKAWGQYSKTDLAQWKIFTEQMRALAIVIGHALMPALNALAHAILPPLQAIATFASQHTTITAAFIGLAIGIGALAGIAKVLLAFEHLYTLMKTSMILTKTWAVATKVAAGAQWLWNEATTAGAIQGKLYTAWLYASAGLQKAWAAGTWLMTAAQDALNAAFLANPIGMFILAAIAVVAIIVVLYKNWTGFRNVVNFVFADLKKFASWLQGVMVPTWNKLKGALVGFLGWLRNNWKMVLVIMLAPFLLIIVAVIKFGPNLLKLMSRALNGVLSWIRANWQTVLYDILWYSPYGLIVQGVLKFGPWLLKQVSTFLGNIVDWVTKNWKSVIVDILWLTPMGTVTNLAIKFGPNLLKTLMHGLKPILDAVKGWGGALFKVFKDAFSKLGSFLTDNPVVQKAVQLAHWLGIGGSGALPGSGTGGGMLNAPSSITQYSGAIQAAAKATGIPASVIASQVYQESRGKKGVRSWNSAEGVWDIGLMQYGPAEAKTAGGKYTYDPAQNIMTGAKYLAYLRKQHGGSLSAALAAYNGSGAYATSVLARAKTYATPTFDMGGSAKSNVGIGALGAPGPAVFYMPTGGAAVTPGPLDRAAVKLKNAVGHTDIGEPAGTPIRLPGGHLAHWTLVYQGGQRGVQWGLDELWQSEDNGGLIEMLHMRSMAKIPWGTTLTGGTLVAYSGGQPGVDTASNFSSAPHLHIGYDAKGYQAMAGAASGRGFVSAAPINSGLSGYGPSYGVPVGGSGPIGGSKGFTPISYNAKTGTYTTDTTYGAKVGSTQWEYGREYVLNAPDKKHKLPWWHEMPKAKPALGTLSVNPVTHKTSEYVASTEFPTGHWQVLPPAALKVGQTQIDPATGKVWKVYPAWGPHKTPYWAPVPTTATNALTLSAANKYFEGQMTHLAGGRTGLTGLRYVATTGGLRTQGEYIQAHKDMIHFQTLAKNARALAAFQKTHDSVAYHKALASDAAWQKHQDWLTWYEVTHLGRKPGSAGHVVAAKYQGHTAGATAHARTPLHPAHPHHAAPPKHPNRRTGSVPEWVSSALHSAGAGAATGAHDADIAQNTAVTAKGVVDLAAAVHELAGVLKQRFSGRPATMPENNRREGLPTQPSPVH